MLPMDVLTVIYDFAPLLTKTALSATVKDLIDYHHKYLKVTRPISNKLYDHLSRGDIVDKSILKYYKIPGAGYLFNDSAMKGHINMTKLLLDYGIDVRANDALCLAANNGHTEIVKLLLNRGADVHANNGRALHWASRNGHIETVKLLFDRGADVHAANGAALRWAACDGHIETVKLLLDHGADINAANGEALYWASRNGHTETVSLMLSVLRDRRANPHAKPQVSRKLFPAHLKMNIPK